MNNSENINEIAAALVMFQQKKPQIDLNSTVTVKTKAGGEYSFKYATIGHTLEKLQPILTECKLAYTQLLQSDNSITTMLIHADNGQYLSSNKPLDLPNGATAQEVGSFITYYKRYALLAMLGVVAEDDEDGNIASGNTASKTEDNNPWLNKFNKDDSIHKDYWVIVNGAKDKGYGVKDLRKYYKISKPVAAELEKDLAK